MRELIQKDHVVAKLTFSCDKYGHPFGEGSERLPRKGLQGQTNAPLADRFGRICRSADLASFCGEQAGENVQV